MAEPERPATTASATKTRGTGFPVISLPTAMRIVSEAGAYGKVHTANALAAYAGHTTANSGAFRAKAAALRDWGLVISAPADSFALTDRAHQIAHPTSPEATQKAMLEAFNNCKLYVEIYNDMAKGTDLKIASVANTAVTSHGVAAKSKDAFANSFVESAAAVGLAKKMSADIVQLLTAPVEVPGVTGTAIDGTAVNDEIADGPEVLVKKRRSPTTPVVNQTWPISNGEITLTISSGKPFDGKVFVEIGSVIGAVEKLVELIGAPADEDEE